MRNLYTNYYVFPFDKVDKGTKIVIYGMGNVGRDYINQILTTNYCTILFAVDTNYKTVQNNSVPVYGPEKLNGTELDYVVLATDVINNAIGMRDTVLSFGISKDKIIVSQQPYNDNAVISTMERMDRRISKINTAFNEVLSNIAAMKRVMLSIDSYIMDSYFKTVAPEQKSKYDAYYAQLYDLLTVYKSPLPFCRVGKHNDGGYLMAEHFDGTIAYSFGISNDVSWDLDMVKYGYDVFMYDPTIEGLPQENSRFHYLQKGIADASFNSQDYWTLDTFIRKNKHENLSNMILKMDVEGAEWGFLNTVTEKELRQFSQIVMELHDLTLHKNEEKIINGLNKLRKTHVLIHRHANNFCVLNYTGDRLIPNVIEVVFLSKDYFTNYDLVPYNFIGNEYDEPCWPERREIEFF